MTVRNLLKRNKNIQLIIFDLRDVVLAFLIFIKKTSNRFKTITTLSQGDRDTTCIRQRLGSYSSHPP